MESDCNAIVKQELIIDDLKAQDYEHLLREFYYDDEPDSNTSGEVQIQDDLPDPEEVATSSLEVERGPDGYWNCPVCTNSFRLRISFDIHVKKHFRCATCELSFLTKVTYDQHNQHHHGLLAPPVFEYNQVPLAELRNVSPEPFCCAPPSLESHSSDLLLETFDEEAAHPGYFGDDLISSVIVKEEFVFEGQDDADGDETSLVSVLHRAAENNVVGTAKSTGAKRPEHAQQCPVCKVWYHTVAGLEKHLLRHQLTAKLTNGKQKPGTVAVKKVVQTNKSRHVTKDDVPPEKKTELYCARCDITFVSHQNYKLHEIRHTNIDSGRFKCNYCSKSLASNFELVYHESRNHLTSPTKPSPIVLKEAKVIPEQTTNCKQPTIRPRKGRPKGSRKCPLCKQWFLTQDELRVHFTVHNPRSKQVVVKHEEKRIKEDSDDGQERESRIDAKQTVNLNSPALGKPLELKSEPILNERRKVGRPKGSRKRESIKVKPELDITERGEFGRPRRIRQCTSPLELKSEPILNERRKVGRPKGSRNRESVKVKPELDIAELGEVGRPRRIRQCTSVKSEPALPQPSNLNEIKSERVSLERRKAGRPKRSRSQKLDGIKLEPSLPERRGVGRPRKSEKSSPNEIRQVRRKAGRPKGSKDIPKVLQAEKLRGIQLLRQARRKVGRPKGSKNSLQSDDDYNPKVTRPIPNKSLAYCARCDKKFPTYASFKCHKIRHQNFDLGRFVCKQCKKAFASKNEQIIHEQNGHKLKPGRPSMAGSVPESTPELSPHQKRTKKSSSVDETPIRRKVGRPRKHPPTVDIVQIEHARKAAGRPQQSRKCPLCKVWFRSVAMFKDHLRSHIQE